MVRYVYSFTEGSKEQKDLLGGKGANLAEMTRLGLPVPPGFTITTEACRAYLATGRLPVGLKSELDEHLTALEKVMGRSLGDPDDPLLVSVRSGAKFSMPGMMETVLDLGLNDESVVGLAPSERQRAVRLRLLPPAAADVRGHRARASMPRRSPCELDKLKAERGVFADVHLDVDDLRGLVATYQAIIREHTGRDFPQDPREQVHAAVLAVFSSWLTERAVLYRRQEQIPDDLGTAVNVQAMVFGNRGTGLGLGRLLHPRPRVRLPAACTATTSPMPRARTSWPASATPSRSPTSRRIDKPSYDALLDVMCLLERHYRDLCDIEFTIESGRLWILQTRVGKRTPEAAFRIARAMVDEGLIDADEAVRRVTGEPARAAAVPALRPAAAARAPDHRRRRLARSHLRPDRAHLGQGGDLGSPRRRRRARPPRDQPGRPARHDRGAWGAHRPRRQDLARGRRGPRHGPHLRVRRRAAGHRRRAQRGPGLRATPSWKVTWSRSTAPPARCSSAPSRSPTPRCCATSKAPRRTEEADGLVEAVAFVMDHADRVRRMEVRANADTAEDAARARRFGAAGVGLCRTEHMFLGPRRELVERLILATDEAAREAALAELLPLQRQDFTEILREMDGLPVTIRLIDPPLHEFLPDHTELAVQVALEDVPEPADARHHTLLDAVARLQSRTPCWGCAACGSASWSPAWLTMQARAVLEAAADRIAAGGDPRPEIMIPLVATAPELALVRAQIEAVAEAVRIERGIDLPVRIGTMIEVPRAALTADQIAGVRGLLLLRHQRPDPADLGLLARRRRGGVLPDLPRPGHPARLAVRVDRRGRRGSAGGLGGPAGPADPSRAAPGRVR